MKNFIRICTAALVAGMLLCIGGIAAGGTLYSSLTGNGPRPFGRWFPRLRWETQAEYDQRTGAGRDSGSVWVAADPDVSDALPDIPNTLPGITELEKLDLQLGSGEFYIITGDKFGYTSSDGHWITSTVENGVWKLRTDTKWFNFGLSEPRVCTITIPEGCTLQQANWTLGAANVEISAPITAQKLEIEAGAANVSFLAPVTAEKADLEIGAGNLAFSLLDVSDDLDAEIGAGNLDMVLAGSVEDYTIQAEVTMGTVSVNDRDLAFGFAGEHRQGHGKRKIKLEAGMGSVNIYTEQTATGNIP